MDVDLQRYLTDLLKQFKADGDKRLEDFKEYVNQRFSAVEGQISTLFDKVDEFAKRTFPCEIHLTRIKALEKKIIDQENRKYKSDMKTILIASTVSSCFWAGLTFLMNWLNK